MLVERQRERQRQREKNTDTSLRSSICWAVEADAPDTQRRKIRRILESLSEAQRRQSKSSSSESLFAFVKSGIDAELIIAGARRCAEADRDKIGTEYIPQSIKWLRDRRWEDYAVIAGPNDRPSWKDPPWVREGISQEVGRSGNLQRSTERAFGEIPDWAKLGPISLKNYDYRAEANMALHSVKLRANIPRSLGNRLSFWSGSSISSGTRRSELGYECALARTDRRNDRARGTSAMV